MTDFVFRHLYNYILSLRSDLGISFLISECFHFSINLSGGGEPHNVIEDGHR